MQNPTSGGLAAHRTHTVVAGDSLASIAYAEYGDARPCGGPWPRPTASTTPAPAQPAPACSSRPPEAAAAPGLIDPPCPRQQHTSKFEVQVDGTPAARRPGRRRWCRPIVDDSLNLPDLFQLTFRDPDAPRSPTASSRSARRSSVQVFSDAAPGGRAADHGRGHRARGRVRPERHDDRRPGLRPVPPAVPGPAHRDLHRRDLLRRRPQGRRAGRPEGRARSTPPRPSTTTSSQGNVTDWEFLTGLAPEIGFEVGLLRRQVRVPQARPIRPAAPASGIAHDATTRCSSCWARTCCASAPPSPSSEQVKEVQVRGWDMRQKKALVGTAAGRDAVGARSASRPPSWPRTFGSPAYVGVRTPVRHPGRGRRRRQGPGRADRRRLRRVRGRGPGQPQAAGRHGGQPRRWWASRSTASTPSPRTRHVYDPKDGLHGAGSRSAAARSGRCSGLTSGRVGQRLGHGRADRRAWRPPWSPTSTTPTTSAG